MYEFISPPKEEMERYGIYLKYGPWPYSNGGDEDDNEWSQVEEVVSGSMKKAFDGDIKPIIVELSSDKLGCMGMSIIRKGSIEYELIAYAEELEYESRDNYPELSDDMYARLVQAELDWYKDRTAGTNIKFDELGIEIGVLLKETVKAKSFEKASQLMEEITEKALALKWSRVKEVAKFKKKWLKLMEVS